MDSTLSSRRLVEALPTAALLIVGRALWLNSAAELLTGYSRDEIPSIDVYLQLLVAPAAGVSGGECLARFDARRAALDPKVETLSVACRDGTRRSIEHRYGVLESGEIWLLRDVSEQMQAEEKARQQSRLLNRVGRLAQIGGWEIDVVTGAVVWSDQVYHLYEIDPQTPITTAVTEAPYSREVLARVMEVSVKSFQPGSPPWEMEVPFAGAKGLQRRVQLVGEVEFEDGKATRAIGTVQDVTERHRTNEALNEARRKAEAASSAKSEFLANMSHEIRTPMNGVIGMTELLLETQLEQVQRDYAQTVIHSANALLTVINDILDFSKVEAGKLELQCIDMNPRDAIQEVARLLAIQAHAKDLELTIEVDPRVPDVVRGDGGRLRQVLLNLGGNGVKFTQQGEVSLDVKLLESNESGEKLLFEVRDTGLGIPAHRLSALFQPFSQVDSSTTRQFGGTGLGLSIVRSLVELMGGETGVESAEGRGSRFWFTARFAAASKHALPKRSSPQSLKNLRILVVDDNATNRKILATQLAHCGCHVTCATSADEAAKIMRDSARAGHPFKAALVDHQMPGRDGADLGREIVADAELKSTRLILLTSSGQGGEGRFFAEIGFAAYLLKPLSQRDLVDCLLVTIAEEADAWHTRTQPIVTSEELTLLRARNKRRILVAEDNVVNQKVARRLLEKMGHEITVVNNGLAAVQAWETQPFDLILMDCQMPELDGYRATAQIRQRENGERRIPIIALTAHAMKGAEVACLEAGMDEHLTKPIDRKRLEETLERFLPEDSRLTRTKDLFDAARTPNAAVPPLDLDALRVLMQGNAQQERDLIQSFVQNADAAMREIAEAVSMQDLTAVSLGAHRLKDASKEMHASGARQMAESLEAAAAARDAERVREYAGQLRVEVARIGEFARKR